MRAHFILVGLLFLCGLSIGKECSPELLSNVDFQGRNIETLSSPAEEHCQHLCTQHPTCEFFTFKNWNLHCYLKSGPSGQPTGQTSQWGVTSGFSLKSCKTNSKPCLSKVYHSVDFFGADYRALFTPDYEECQRVCTNDPTCQFFTFLDGNYLSEQYRYKCLLKFSWTIPRTTTVKQRAGLVSGFSHNIHTQQSDTGCRPKLFPNADIRGNDLENLAAASPEHCHALCSAHPQCTYFSYASDFICYLKNNPEEMWLIAKDGFTSGIPARFCQPDNTWTKTHEGVDFWGSHYDSLVTDDAEACQRACTEDPNCQFYSYATDSFSETVNRHRCFLKRVITVPAPPVVAEKSDLVSGFSLRNCAPSALPAPKPVTEDVFVCFD